MSVLTCTHVRVCSAAKIQAAPAVLFGDRPNRNFRARNKEAMEIAKRLNFSPERRSTSSRVSPSARQGKSIMDPRLSLGQGYINAIRAILEAE